MNKMKLHILVLLSASSLLLTACSGDSSSPSEQNVLTDILSLEMTFGDDDSQDEKFLLANPNGLAVDDEMNVLVADEFSLKVFDTKGNPKTIIGQKGQGPNEFDASLLEPTISPTGVLTAKANWGQTYNIYDKDLKFINKINYNHEPAFELIKNELKWKFLSLYSFYKLGESKHLFYVAGRLSDRKEIHQKWHQAFAYIEGGNLQIITQESFVQSIYYDGRGIGLPYRAGLLFTLLPGDRIAYSHHNYESIENDEHVYTIKIADFEGNIVLDITHPFDQISLPDSLGLRKGSDEREEKIYEYSEEYLKKNPYYHALGKIMADRNYIFAFTYPRRDEENILTDIFDSDTGNYLRSVYFPFIPRVIKNGRAFRIKRGQDIFPSVEVYTIDERVYRK